VPAIELEPGEELTAAEAAVSRLDGERVREHIERSVGRDDPP
jgi:adenylylsulfate kinase-like enzyme